MKQLNLLTASKWMTAGLLLTSLFGVGCAKKADSPPAPVTAPGQTVAPDPNSRSATAGMNYQSGATASFSPVNVATMNTYAGTHPLNNPTNYSVNVNLTDNGSGRYSGTVQVSYYDNGNYYNGYFISGTGNVNVSYQNRDTGKFEAEFNQWFTYNGQKVFHGFFQDQYGAVVLVVDDAISGGDGGAPSEVNGSIYFKNFAPTYATQSAEKCWFIRIGPFDCRTFIGGDDNIQTTSSLYPGNGYTKLGSFSGLNYRKAFNIQ